jgi:hypothetical protein
MNSKNSCGVLLAGPKRLRLARVICDLGDPSRDYYLRLSEANRHAASAASSAAHADRSAVKQVVRNGVARWRSSQDGSDEQMFGAE